MNFIVAGVLIILAIYGVFAIFMTLYENYRRCRFNKLKIHYQQIENTMKQQFQKTIRKKDNKIKLLDTYKYGDYKWQASLE